MALVGIFILTAFMVGWDVPKMISRKQWRELVVYTAILFAGAGAGSAMALGLQLPSPTKMVIFIYHPIAVLVDKILG